MTSAQLPLTLPQRGAGASPSPRGARRSPRERFEAFHAANPHVYDLLVGYSRQALRAARLRGRSRIGIRAVWERMRWDLDVETKRGADDFKLNDHLTAFYARLLMAREPDLAECFETRER